jgi:hypothetical protein
MKTNLSMYPMGGQCTKESFQQGADITEGVSGQASIEDYYEDPTQRPITIRSLNHGGADFKGEK